MKNNGIKKQDVQKPTGIWKEFWEDESGVGVIELVLILVVLIALVIIFKKEITTLLNNIFTQINAKSKEVY